MMVGEAGNMTARAEDRELAGGDRLSRVINRVIRILAALILWPFFLPRAQGKRLEPPPGQGCILIANHHHLLDPIFITQLYKSDRLSFVAKQELYSMKLIGRILKAFRAIPLDRSTADIRASKLILSQIKAGRIVGIFLQGTRVKLADAAKLEPHASLLYYAIRRGIPVMSVAIDPRYGLFGRPRYIFAPPVLYKLKEAETLKREQQEAIARELMRRIYAMADLPYVYEGMEANQVFFEETIEMTPLAGTTKLGAGA
ncbi:MAG: 1-acyl-sn-glycerol-3-phosphate acyltransferase [Clostridiaceae bacterium]|nr:1-acyl-sn-glycerol-3-phosphate acyltransferase [Clostridiaceae bacterium]